MVRLEIPYRSQWDKMDADQYNADCGPTCISMVLSYHQIPSSANAIYALHFPHKGKGDFTTFSELMEVLNQNGVGNRYLRSRSRAEALASLRANIDAGKPLIALVKYSGWRSHFPISANQFNGGHFVVVTGYDDAHITMHDPLFGLWVTPATRGAHYAMPIDLFCAAWGGFNPENNPNWAHLILDGPAAVVVEPVPQPATPPAIVPTPEQEPASVPPPVTEPEPVPVSESTGPLTAAEERRIRALAAYRWTEPPDFADATAVALWRSHLGDWGLTVLEHVVQPGDTYSGLAQRYYGEAHRWEALRVFNDFPHEGLWVGETVRVPQHGSSDAHKNPALPSDTLDEFGSEESFLDGWVDPNAAAFDYDALWDDSIQLAPIEPEAEQ
jgi:hypothetical protein